MREVSLELFLLMSNLAQIDNSETVLRLFSEAINSLDPGFSVQFMSGEPSADAAESLEVRTLSNHFGIIRLIGKPQTIHPEFPSLFQNAVQMLAVILERNRHQSLLMDESLRLQALVGEKVASIRRNEALLNESQALAKVGGWEWNPRTNVMYWTRECFSIYEIDPDSMPQESRELAELSLSCYRPEDRPAIQEASVRCVNDGIPFDGRFPFTTTQGRKIWIRATAKAIGEPGQVEKVVGNIMDISEQVASEAALRSSLEEKEALIRELYHRTKNNMNVICSMLELKSANVADPEVISIFDDMGKRIQAMSLVHSRLYKSQNLSRIELDEYLKEVVSSLIAGHRADHLDLSLVFDLQPLNVPFDLAIPVGLFVNEAVTNSLKHAFGNRRKGTIGLQLKNVPDNQILLVVEDDGIGMSESQDPLASASLGWMIITGIAQSQLSGELTVRRSPGLRFELRFRNDLYKPRV